VYAVIDVFIFLFVTKLKIVFNIKAIPEVKKKYQICKERNFKQSTRATCTWKQKKDMKTKDRKQKTNDMSNKNTPPTLKKNK
jgi:hypothetical protein